MSSRGFINGLLAGSVIGALLGAFILPQEKPEPVQRIAGRSRRFENRAGTMARQVAEGVNDLFRH